MAALPPRARRVLAALADRAVAPGGRVALRPYDVDVVGAVERQLAGAPAILGHGIGALLLWFDLAAPLYTGRARPFLRMCAAEQDRYIGAWTASRLYERRIAMRSLLMLVHSAFYGDVRVSAALGRTPPREAGG